MNKVAVFTERPYSHTVRENWPKIIDSMEERSKLHLDTLTDLLGSPQ